jgi:hypothetical protein
MMGRFMLRLGGKLGFEGAPSPFSISHQDSTEEHFLFGGDAFQFDCFSRWSHEGENPSVSVF